MNTGVIDTAFADLIPNALSYAEAVLPYAIGVLAVSIGFGLVLKFARRAKG